MLSNYKNFNGARLQVARKYRGKTITELAEDIGVTKQSISQFENGQISPQFDTLMKITSTLKFPREYFYEEDTMDIQQGNTYFRALSKMSKKEENVQKERTKMIGKLFSFLNEYIEFPTLNLPKFDENSSIEEKALLLRKHWGIEEEPISDILYLMEKNGIIVTSIFTDSDNVDAFSQPQRINGKKYYFVVLGNDKWSATRRQFSAAHELGHIILHDDFIDLENMTREELRHIENEAHEFAAAFLLPKNAFANDVNLYPTTLNYYKQLKKKWKTSISAMLVRANRLDILSYSSYQTLMKKMSRLGWRTEEPLDDTLVMSKPTVLKRAVDILIDNDILDEKEFLKELSSRGLTLPREEIELLLGLEEGRLLPKKIDNKIIEMPVRKI
ncbi:ImmA/IrrE family metallo-endopeptidase [Clostridium sp. 19966]|uniref:XRE family transcriptional regulator n=1 Tax=Clostridium sp. 19966 TaxID=2768166 RepID=UPI0028DEF19E|nr:XRE family transcriptional regulator [Clostridium sp. 19966]MDT8717621.1 ImmA/IrrE family metallo-endopeptidase [Clostridium sp. 19966]